MSVDTKDVVVCVSECVSNLRRAIHTKRLNRGTLESWISELELLLSPLRSLLELGRRLQAEEDERHREIRDMEYEKAKLKERLADAETKLTGVDSERKTLLEILDRVTG